MNPKAYFITITDTNPQTREEDRYFTYEMLSYGKSSALVNARAQLAEFLSKYVDNADEEMGRFRITISHGAKFKDKIEAHTEFAELLTGSLHERISDAGYNQADNAAATTAIANIAQGMSEIAIDNALNPFKEEDFGDDWASKIYG